MQGVHWNVDFTKLAQYCGELRCGWLCFRARITVLVIENELTLGRILDDAVMRGPTSDVRRVAIYCRNFSLANPKYGTSFATLARLRLRRKPIFAKLATDVTNFSVLAYGTLSAMTIWHDFLVVLHVAVAPKRRTAHAG